MHPIKYAGSNFVYRGPTPEIGDLWVERVHPHRVHVVYDFDDNERKLIAEGGRIELAMFHEPIPPISMRVLHEGTHRPVGEHGWKGQELESEPRDPTEEEELDAAGRVWPARSARHEP
jgi:hypothetical protein